jgi:hypothetical protein
MTWQKAHIATGSALRPCRSHQRAAVKQMWCSLLIGRQHALARTGGDEVLVAATPAAVSVCLCPWTMCHGAPR